MNGLSLREVLVKKSTPSLQEQRSKKPANRQAASTRTARPMGQTPEQYYDDGTRMILIQWGSEIRTCPDFEWLTPSGF